MAGKSFKPITIGEALNKFLRQEGLWRRGHILEICRTWHEVVGEEISRHTRVSGFRRGVLAVEVDSPTWFYELSQFHRPALLEKMKAKLPGEYVADIRFRLVR